MSADELKRFSEAVKSDPALQEELGKVGADGGAIVALAADKGFTFTLEELNARSGQMKGELDEEQLDKIAGAGDSHIVVDILVC